MSSTRRDEHAARAEWDDRAVTPGVADRRDHIPAPTGLVAEEGVGHVTLRWEPVTGAIGYEVLRGDGPDSLSVLDHQADDLLAVGGPPYVDTTGERGRRYHYAVAALATIEDGSGPVGATVPGRSRAASDGLSDNDHAPTITATVDLAGPTTPLVRPWWMVGAEHVSQLRYAGGSGPDPIAQEYATALARAHDELGVTHVRAHAILDDENGVVVADDDGWHVDVSTIVDLYTRLGELGLRPVVELGFMPAALARDPDQTVFTYEGIISTPTHWEDWQRLVRKVVGGLVDHFGIDEVVRWPFEVWNEPNLDAFWTGTSDDYHRMYDLAAAAVKEVDERLLVGGPATAAVGWVGTFLDHVRDTGVPLDFLTTHVYGVGPLDLRPALAERGLDDVRIWWTEWGVSPRHFRVVNDAAFGAPFVLAGMKAAASTADALAYWVVSDHFEELGRPTSLLHGGFGLQTVGNLRKPRWWALALAHAQGDDRLALDLSGDGADGLVDGWATRHDDGTIDVLLWNGTLDQTRVDGDDALCRRVEVHLPALDGPRRVTIARVDDHHSNVTTRYDRDDGWPTDDQWADLAAADVLDEREAAPAELSRDDADLVVTLDLPMPGVARVRVSPAAG
ncbi:GH39 family glycosyl hydrolase [Salsipaludibacter albus]|uniref:GH39 family glycosyl hydrolase n=1 Tax=Salsipaludibacter albus TaxID=2849650 RepID=UPI001EE47115|nr:xylan 1,4-beta-xylosidase [Salsipaludibacter albus]MBY5164161.1 xylan 1,4-beta-xylosidase [Salsipaludibacter albus]